ncbi:MAG TPA: hypothetical protein VG095_02445 [Chthoniobacterales bacterium]|nr:hypothetical protein [Chthoniobacterales bacterium]
MVPRNFRGSEQFNFSKHMKREDDQALWDLLGKRSAPELSPFFARNVVRAVRQQAQESGWRGVFATWLRPRRLVPATAVALALFTGALVLQQRVEEADGLADTPPELLAGIDPQDLEIVAELEDLLAEEDDT